MKILILLKKWDGGVGSVVKSIEKEFKKKGHIVKIISREDDLKINFLINSLFSIRKRVKRLMKIEKFDVIYTQDWSLALPLIFPYSIFKKKHFSVFYGEENNDLSLFFQSIVGEKIGKRAIVCNDSLKKRFPKASLIYNRVDHNFFVPFRKEKRIKNSVGFANWKTEEYHFNNVKKAVEEAGKKLIVAENIPKEKMPEFYNKIEVFISLPPRYAGFGLVYLEAMACGVPKIIGNNYGGGKKLPITKIEEYDENIEKAILKAEKINYRKWIIENNFTWEDATGKLLNIFKKNT